MNLIIMLRIIIFQVLFIFAAQLCAANDHHADSPADTLVGLVVNNKNKGLKNIPVTARHKEGVIKTNRKGIFVIPNVSLHDTLTLIIPKNKIFVIPASGMSFLKIAITGDKFVTTQAKEEIVDIGYGSVKKNRSTTANAVLSGDELRETGQNDIQQALAGKVSGLNLVYLDDGTQTVSIRGGTSLTLDNSPLFVLDGVIVENLSHVNINDVQQVTIMKEAPIYGTRGANGAIVVKTK
jgi:hypothetical protein